MKKTTWLACIFYFSLVAKVLAAPVAPVISYATEGLNLHITWTQVPNAAGYTLFYAPYPYTGDESIRSMAMASNTSFSIDLWDEADYYIAVKAFDDQGSSNYSNIERFTTRQNVNTSSLPLPNQKLGVFYYPWYGTPSNNPGNSGYWNHWEANDNQPPEDIAADYYPVLGPYSSADRAVVEQHFKWIREAGIGVVITSWWGLNSYEDDRVPLLLDVAEQYGLKVAFHIEPYATRTSDSLVNDIQYLYAEYGDHPAFYRTTETSFQATGSQAKGLFFVWSTDLANHSLAPVTATYWRDALDRIHALPDGAIVISTSRDPGWLEDSHFDGAYNYAAVDTDPGHHFQWQSVIPRGAWYVPSVIPGFEDRRNNPEIVPNLPRNNGQTYLEQWAQVTSGLIEPMMITVTSFNEWHEGTQIEPAMTSQQDSRGALYASYGGLGEKWYLETTLEMSRQVQDMEWPKFCPVQLVFQTTSDWAEFDLGDGADWLYLSVTSASSNAVVASVLDDGRLHLVQSIEDAINGATSEMTVTFNLSATAAGTSVEWHGESGGLGGSRVDLMDESGVVIDSFQWRGEGPWTFNMPAAVFSCSN